MEKFSRAQRRADIARLKQNRKNYYRNGISYGQSGIQLMSARALGRVSQDPQPCSCYGCGNPRKHFGEITCKEKLHLIDVEFYLKGYVSDMI
jgi:hypothetical protein